jgi:hypothetical protein
MIKRLLSLLGIKESSLLSEEDMILLEEIKKDIPFFDKDTGEAFNWYYYFADVPLPPFNEKTGEPSSIEHRLVIQHCSFRKSHVETFWNHKTKSIYRGLLIHSSESEEPPYGGKPLICEKTNGIG